MQWRMPSNSRKSRMVYFVFAVALNGLELSGCQYFLGKMEKQNDHDLIVIEEKKN